jgi:peroxiredoxin
MAATSTQIVLGTPALDFQLPATDGRTYTLDDIAGVLLRRGAFVC